MPISSTSPAVQHLRFSVFQNLGVRKRTRENTSSFVRVTYELGPERIHFGADVSGWVGVGSGQDRVRVNFGWTNSLATLGFKKVVPQNNCHFRKTKMIKFRDTLGLPPEQKMAKIIPLRCFNLLVQKPSVTLAHNPLVGGSSPPGPTILLIYNKYL